MALKKTRSTEQLVAKAHNYWDGGMELYWTVNARWNIDAADDAQRLKRYHQAMDIIRDELESREVDPINAEASGTITPLQKDDDPCVVAVYEDEIPF